MNPADVTLTTAAPRPTATNPTVATPTTRATPIATPTPRPTRIDLSTLLATAPLANVIAP